MKRVPRIDDLPIDQVEALESGDLEQIQEVMDELFDRRGQGGGIRKVGMLLWGFLRALIAFIVSIIILELIIRTPLWLWRIAAIPLDSDNLTVGSVILMIIVASIILGGFTFWIVALCMAPGGMIKVIAPDRRWVHVSIATIMILSHALGTIGLVVFGVAWGASKIITMYLIASAVIAYIGLLATVLSRD